MRCAQKQHFRRAVFAFIQRLKPTHGGRLIGGALKDHERVWCDPAARRKLGQRCVAESAMIGRVQEHKIKRPA
jgi:hypothetical protein